LGAAYGITEDLTVGVRLPYIFLNNIKEAHSDEPEEVHVHGDVEGLGDLSLLGNYRFFARAAAGFESSVLFGVKAPTGETDKEDIEGERFETEFQPGSGSWDFMAGFAAEKRFK